MVAKKSGRPVYIVDGSRTPFLKVRGPRGPFGAADLAVSAARQLLLRQPFEPSAFEEVIFGCVIPNMKETNIARVIALRIGCGKRVPAWTVNRNCASGMQAIDCAARSIATGRSELVLAGGTESMSHAPLYVNGGMQDWLAGWNSRKPLWEKLKSFSAFRPSFLQPVVALLHGLTDPVVGLSMGQTAENLAYRFSVGREEMDAFSLASHEKLARAIDNGYLAEVETLVDVAGKVYGTDDGLRRDSSMEKLKKLRPVFDRPVGHVTAGNSAQVTDGAAAVVMASEDAVKKYNLPTLGRVVDTAWAGVDPAEMGLGPVHAMAPLLDRHKLFSSDVDYWEINEAFSAQVLACLKAFGDGEYIKNEVGIKRFAGGIDPERLNVDGGAVSIGHPVGASGARIVLHLLRILERTNTKRGVASLCIGGGQGGAMLLERDAG